MHQKGFIGFIVLILVAAAVLVGGYYLLTHYSIPFINHPFSPQNRQKRAAMLAQFDVTQAIAVNEKSRIILINPTSPTETEILYSINGQGSIQALKWSADHRHIALIQTITKSSGGCDKNPCGPEIGVIDTKTGMYARIARLNPLSANKNQLLNTFSWFDDNQTMMYTDGVSIYKWSINSQPVLIKSINDTVVAGSASMIHPTANGIFYSNGEYLGNFPLIQPDQSTKLFIRQNGSDDLSTMTIAPNNKVAVYGNSTLASLFNLDDDTTTFLEEFPCGNYTFVGFTADSQKFALLSYCGQVGSVEIFDQTGNRLATIPTDNLLKSLSLPKDAQLLPKAAAFSPDGNKLYIYTLYIDPKSHQITNTDVDLMINSDGTQPQVVKIGWPDDKQNKNPDFAVSSVAW